MRRIRRMLGIGPLITSRFEASSVVGHRTHPADKPTSHATPTPTPTRRRTYGTGGPLGGRILASWPHTVADSDIDAQRQIGRQGGYLQKDGARMNGHGQRRRRRPKASLDSSTTTSAAHQAQSVTTSLRRTKDMLSQELDRVANLNTTIVDDGALLSETKNEHEGMGGTMKGAKHTMHKLGRQDIRDAFILRMAIVFYWACVSYVLWTRIKIPFLP